MTEGAGKGPGLKGDGSQNSGQDVHTTASAGSGQATATGKPNAGAHMAPPMELGVFAVTGLSALFAIFGALLV